MAASTQDISGWFDEGVRKGATHMIVVCDTFDFEDAPTYVMPGVDVRWKLSEIRGKEFTRIMEVYALHLDKAAQLAEPRAHHLELPIPRLTRIHPER